MENQYWLKREGKVYGPYSGIKLKKLAALGKIRNDDQLSADNQSWQLAGRVAGLFPQPRECHEQVQQESNERQCVVQPDSVTAGGPSTVETPICIRGLSAHRVQSTKMWLILGSAMLAGLVTTIVIWPGGHVDKLGNIAADRVLTLGDAEDKAMEDIQAFLNDGGKIDGEYYHHDRLTPLQWACVKGYVRVAAYLLASDADTATEDADGVTALHYAASWGHTPIVRLLLEGGARPNTKSGAGKTALSLAGSSGNVQAIQLLIEHGADPEHLGWSSAHRAVANSDITILRELAGGDIDKTDRFGLTAVQLAVEAGRPDILEALLDLGADFHVRTKPYGRSLISLAAHKGHLSTIRTLLDRGLRVDILDKNDMTPLHWNGFNSNVTALLIQRGARIDDRDSKNRTPLHYASAGPVVRELINAGADVNVTDKDGRTPLHMATARTVVEELLAAGADPNRTDRNGRTPLYSASLASIVDLLVKHGADPTVRDDKDMMPADVVRNTHVGGAIERAYGDRLAARATSRDWPAKQRKLMGEVTKFGEDVLHIIRNGAGRAFEQDITRALNEARRGVADPRAHAAVNQLTAEMQTRRRRMQAEITAYNKKSVRLVEQARSLKELRSLLKKRYRTKEPDPWEKEILNRSTARVKPNNRTPNRDELALALGNTVPALSKPSTPIPNRGRQLSLKLADGVTMKLVSIKAGKFMRAATKYWSKERPVQQVTLTMPFYMGVTEVTRAQWKAVMKTQPWPQYSSIAGDTAANYINWWDATAFCKALSKKTGRTVRLPTEAEWEYACRAGTTTAYSFGDDRGQVKNRKFVYKLGDYAWYEGNTDNRPRPVGKKKPNPWGLYDMHGNVSEWCTDWYDGLYANKNICNPKGPTTGTLRVLRGGSCCSGRNGCVSDSRNGGLAGGSGDSRLLALSRSHINGLRVVVEIGADVD